MNKEFWGVITLVLAFGGSVPYIRDIFKGKTKPHIFSWLVWTALIFIIFFIQVGDNAGPGAWSSGFTGLICLFILILAISKSRQYITKTDVWLLVAAMAAMIPWLFTKNALLSTILISVVDFLAYSMTMRKSWHHPHAETLSTYILTFAKHVISLLAMRNYSLVTSFYPGYLVVANLVMIGILVGRRRYLAQKPELKPGVGQ